MDSLRKAIEKLELSDEDLKDKDTYSPNQVRLANMLMVNSMIKQHKGRIEMTSILRETLEQTINRDILMKIGRKSPAFSIFRVFKHQSGC